MFVTHQPALLSAKSVGPTFTQLFSVVTSEGAELGWVAGKDRSLSGSAQVWKPGDQVRRPQGARPHDPWPHPRPSHREVTQPCNLGHEAKLVPRPNSNMRLRKLPHTNKRLSSASGMSKNSTQFWHGDRTRFQTQSHKTIIHFRGQPPSPGC